MRSMFTGVTGLRGHQARMDVIGNNIANVNTPGFKASRMTFADAFSQSLRSAGPPNPDFGRGGSNPMQVGLGMNVASIQRLMSQGGAMRTDDPFHMMLDGDGFFVVGDNVGGTFFTRAGNFNRDRDYNIHAPGGLILQGWPATTDANGNLMITPMGTTEINRAPVQGIQITPAMRQVPARATGNIQFTGNLDSRAAGPIFSSINFLDSLGNSWTVEVEIIRETTGPDDDVVPNTWSVVFSNYPVREDGFTATLSVPIPPVTLEFNTSGDLYDITAAPPAMTTGSRLFSFALDGAPFGVEFGQPSDLPGIEGNVITIDFGQFGQRSGGTSAVSTNLDGIVMGVLQGLSFGEDGVITGLFSNGQNFALWQVAVANFANPAGLESMGNNMFRQTANSGAFDSIGSEPLAIGSTVLAGHLEMSNVDLASEFTEMITTQRGFQANSRVITTSDEILQELVNLRR